MENEKIKLLKKEFQEEIDNEKVDITQLRKNKISNSVLSAEITLRKVFGDEIFVPKKTEETIGGEKTIVKLSEEDISFDSRVRELCEELPDAKFDANVSVVLSKISEEGK